MEFLATTRIPATAAELQQRLTISTLPHWCVSVENVLSDAGAHGDIYCVWGAFVVHREDIHGGVRFSLPGCPNAFQWTVTTEQAPDPQQTVIHVTINRSEPDPDFIDSIELFVTHWKAGLEAHW
jgi:hypothetical protein